MRYGQEAVELREDRESCARSLQTIRLRHHSTPALLSSNIEAPISKYNKQLQAAKSHHGEGPRK